MLNPVFFAVVYIGCGIWAAVFWAFAFRDQIAARRITLSSLFVLVAIEAGVFYLLGVFLGSPH